MQRNAPGPKGSTIAIDDAALDPFRLPAGGSEEPQPVRLAYAAAHLVFKESYRATEHSLEAPGTHDEIAAAVDWDATLAHRRRLDSLGFGIAEAMDTAQRFVVGWNTAERLIEACGALHLEHGFIAGASVDHLAAVRDRDDAVEGVVFQARKIQDAGGQPIVLPLLWLARNAHSEEDYVEIYGSIFERLDGPLWVHWLGEAFHPELGGYFPGESFCRVMALAPDKVRGAKLSLLDVAEEVRIRGELHTRDQLVLTGDDFHFGHLVRGGDPWSEGPAAEIERWVDVGGRRIALGNFSHALLGILDAIAEPAGLALRHLARGDVQAYARLMAPCEELSRWVFRRPTPHYKAGLAFLSWLNGWQANFMLANREERARDVEGLLKTAELAARARVLSNAELAAERIEQLIRAGF